MAVLLSVLFLLVLDVAVVSMLAVLRSLIGQRHRLTQCDSAQHNSNTRSMCSSGELAVGGAEWAERMPNILVDIRRICSAMFSGCFAGSEQAVRRGNWAGLMAQDTV